MTSEAQYKIKEYYTGLRRRYHNVDDQDKTMPITPRQLESIIRLAEAEAKMYLSESVDVKHADRAIDLMNLFLSVTLGGDVDFAFFGADATQRKKDTDPRMRVLSIIDDQGKEGVSEQEIYDIMQEEGYPQSKIQKTIEKMRSDGEILENNYKFVRNV